MTVKAIKERISDRLVLLEFKKSLTTAILRTTNQQASMLREEVYQELGKRFVLNEEVSFGTSLGTIRNFFDGQDELYFARILQRVCPEKFDAKKEELEKISKDLHHYADWKNHPKDVRDLPSSNILEIATRWDQDKKILFELQETQKKALKMLNIALGEDKPMGRLHNRVVSRVFNNSKEIER